MKSVLIVDDDPLLIKLLEFKLGNRGFAVTCVEDGEAALKAAIDRSPDIIVLDGMMPGIDGFEVLRRLKEDMRTKDIPILMLTGRRQESDVLNGLSLGAADYLIKPFSPEELISRIQKALGETVA